MATRPSEARRWSASRSGVALTSQRSARSLARSRSPGASSPWRIAVRRRSSAHSDRVAGTVRCGGGEVYDGIGPQLSLRTGATKYRLSTLADPLGVRAAARQGDSMRIARYRHAGTESVGVVV